MELQNLEAEGFLKHGTWRVVLTGLLPAPNEGELVLAKVLVERGFSLPPNDFFVEILTKYHL
jgi:hypothetical protein